MFNLRGDQRTKGELSKREGGKIFDSGSRTPIAITILVKKPKGEDTEKARIYYRDIGDYLLREDKLKIIREMKSIGNLDMNWVKLTPNQYGDWLNHRNDMFKDFTPMGDKDDKSNKRTFFVPYYSRGLATARDAWCYCYDQQQLISQLKKSIAFYNEQREKFHKCSSNIEVKKFVEYRDDALSWNRGILQYCKSNKEIRFEDDSVRIAVYRPFQKEWVYFNKAMNDMTYQLDKLFPTPAHKNLVICLSCVGSKKGLSVSITDCLPDLHYVGDTQCFPLYWYEERAPQMGDLFSQGEVATNDEDRYIRHDGITDWIYDCACKQYGFDTSKKDIFYYVYGLLHSAEYRETFAADLKKTLPRLPMVDSREEFLAFSRAGRDLAELHLNYESVEEYKGCVVDCAPFTTKGARVNYRVEKMRFGKTADKEKDKSVIYYNDGITISEIPADAYRYVVNGQSAIEWLMERYVVKTDDKSGITNDPNDWAREHGDEQYILKLLRRVINVSVKTMKIVDALPKLKF